MIPDTRARAMRRGWPVVLALCLLVVPSSAQTLDQVSPAAGTEGTRLVVSGSGFGAKRGRVFLVDPDKKKDPPLAVKAWSDDVIEVLIRRAPLAGDTTLEVHTVEGAVVSTPFTVLAPTIASLDKTVIAAGERVVAVVDDLGVRRPRVMVGLKRVPVVRRQKGEGDQRIVTFKVPRRRVATGTWNLSIANRVGAGVLPTQLQITTSKARRIGPKTIRGSLDDLELRVRGGRVKSVAQDGTWVVTGKGRRKDTGATFTLTLVTPQPPAVPSVFSGPPADVAAVTYSETLDGVTTEWSSDGGAALALTAQGVVKKQFGGIVEATLTAPGEADLALSLEFVARRP